MLAGRGAPAGRTGKSREAEGPRSLKKVHAPTDVIYIFKASTFDIPRPLLKFFLGSGVTMPILLCFLLGLGPADPAVPVAPHQAASFFVLLQGAHVRLAGEIHQELALLGDAGRAHGRVVEVGGPRQGAGTDLADAPLLAHVPPMALEGRPLRGRALRKVRSEAGLGLEDPKLGQRLHRRQLCGVGPKTLGSEGGTPQQPRSHPAQRSSSILKCPRRQAFGPGPWRQGHIVVCLGSAVQVGSDLMALDQLAKQFVLAVAGPEGNGFVPAAHDGGPLQQAGGGQIPVGSGGPGSRNRLPSAANLGLRIGDQLPSRRRLPLQLGVWRLGGVVVLAERRLSLGAWRRHPQCRQLGIFRREHESDLVHPQHPGGARRPQQHRALPELRGQRGARGRAGAEGHAEEGLSTLLGHVRGNSMVISICHLCPLRLRVGGLPGSR
mmetsp:Transcript_116870/g.372073  ORF Transcript_116870/g.372073 Transcript_116870/m.372073 type:complete len:436 (-) Transcript_116870:3292-4599(-)